MGKGGVSLSGFYPAGHYEPALLPMRVVYPRPSTETNTYSPERVAYFNPTTQTGILYRKRVGVSFGSWPYVYQLISGPPGMYIEATRWDASWNGNPIAAYTAGYGMVVWTPTAAISSGSPTTVTVRVYDQNYQTDPSSYVDVTWPIHTDTDIASGGVFGFIDVVNGNDSNNGSLSSPWQTPRKAFGSNYSTNVNQGTSIYARAGSYSGANALPGWTDNSSNGGEYLFEFNPQKKPAALIGYPGENPTFVFDGTGSTTGAASMCVAVGNDLLVQDIKLSGYDSSQLNYRWITTGTAYRSTFLGISGDTIGDGSGGGSNAGLMFFFDAPLGAEGTYGFVSGCTVTNRQSAGGGGNSYDFFSAYSYIDLLIELNSSPNPSATGLSGGFYFKSSIEYGECRANFAHYGSQTHCFSWGQSPTNSETGGSGQGPGMQNCESVHNIGINIGKLWFCNASGYTWGTLKAARNSIIGQVACSQTTYNLIAPFQFPPAPGSAGSLGANTYYGALTTYGVSGESTVDWVPGVSNEKSATTTGSNGSVAYSFMPVPNASGYKLYLGTASGVYSQYFDLGLSTSFTYTGQSGVATSGPPSVQGALSVCRFIIDSNAAQTSVALPTGVTVVSDGLNLLNSSGMLDTTTGLFTASYLSSNPGAKGTVGAEIY